MGVLEKSATRLRQTGRLLKTEGVRGAARRIVRIAERRLGMLSDDFPLRAADVADSARLNSPQPPAPIQARPLRVAWITTPPGAGSGGHTTMFRMIEGLERAGHTTSLYLYDVYDGDFAAQERVIREHWPSVTSSVHDSRVGFGDADVWIATSWPTAHVLASHPELHGHRMYFVQDYEPFFYPHGALYTLAEDTYRFGLSGITAGAWLASELAERFGMRTSHFEFGADTNVYTATSDVPRDGVVLYTKPAVARRGHELGVLALQRFARAHPEASIHLFGDPPGDLPFEATSHGRVSPGTLNELYNRCRVGLSLSFTNVSLIPWELLASGVVPVVNDARHNRMVLDNSKVVWADATPGSLADAMGRAWDAYRVDSTPRDLSSSVAGATWDDPSSAVTAHIERTVFG